jgi:hypothetical protein
MAAVPVTLVGILTSEDGGSVNVTFNGIASLAGLGVGGGPSPGGPPPHVEHPIPPVVGGGPIYPPGGGGGLPPWAPGHPEHPIPPTVWPNPPPAGGANPPWWPGYPAHPIPPMVWPEPPIIEGPARIEWKTTWSPDQGWQVVGIITPDVPHPTPS